MDAGDRLGKYRLTQKLGQGAMGVVWAAIDEDTQKEVALKLLVGASQHMRRRLAREAAACQRIDHRHVVRLYDVGSTPENEPFLVMERLSGETLRDLMKREGSLAPEVVAHMGAAIAAGLAAVHDAGVVHRDLKPENVFLHRASGAPAAVVKVLDFGTSQIEMGSDGKLTATGTLLGSPAYMSPEQAANPSDVGPRSDLWSLGVMLFEMLSGRRLFQGSRSLADLVMRVLTEPVPSLASVAPSVPSDLASLVQSCLDRDPEKRVTAAQIAEQLRAWSPAAVGSVPVATPPKQPPSFPTPLGAAPSAGSVQMFRVPAGTAPAKPATPRSAKAPPEVPAAAVPTQSASGRAPWLVAGAAILACLALGVALFVRSGDDTAPSRGRSDKAVRASETEAPRDEAPDSTPRKKRVADAPARPARNARAPEPPKAEDSSPESKVALILDIEVPSQVFLDDLPAGNTPMDKLEVRPGTHQLRFKHATLGERKMTVEARLGVQMVIKVDFEEKEEVDAGGW